MQHDTSWICFEDISSCSFWLLTFYALPLTFNFITCELVHVIRCLSKGAFSRLSALISPAMISSRKESLVNVLRAHK